MKTLMLIWLLLFGATAHASDYREAAWGTLNQIALGALPPDFLGLSAEGGAALKEFADKVVSEVNADAVNSAAAMCADKATLKASHTSLANRLGAIREAERTKRWNAVNEVKKVLGPTDLAIFDDFVYQEVPNYAPAPDVVALIASGNFDRERVFEKICKKGEK